MWGDVEYGIRQWRRNKLFAATIVLLLSVGIGANTLVFSFVHTLLLKSLPVRNPENLFLLEKTRVKQVRPDPSFFYRQFEEVTQERNIFSSALAEQEWSDLSFRPFSTGDSVRIITTQIVSPNYFSELDLHPIAGRVLSREDAVEQANIPAVMSYQFWRAQFAGKQDVIGRTIRIQDHPFLVVGIMPEEFHSIDIERAPDIRLPISAALVLTGSTVDEPIGNDPITFSILTRLAPSVSVAQAAGATLLKLRRMEPDLWRDWWTRSSPPFPRSNLDRRIEYEQNYRLELESVSRGVSRLREQFSRAVLLLMGGVALLMLGICVNIASLLLARGQSRTQEIALRLAMGANRMRVVRQLLGEHLLLAAPTVILSIAITYAAAPWLLKLLPSPRGYVTYAATPRILRVQPDAHVLLFALALSVLSVVLFGLGPLWRQTNVNLIDALKRGGRHATERQTGLANAAFSAALAVVMLTGSVALLRTFWSLEHLNPGFDRGHVVEFTVSPESNGYSETQAGIFRRKLRIAISQIPGVQSISFASLALMQGVGTKTTITPQGRNLPERTFLNTSTMTVTPEYFNTLGIGLLQGRNLDIQDRGRKPARIVVNRAFADFFFPHEEQVVGKQMVEGVDGTKPATAIIVGVVGTAKYRSLREISPPIYYSVSNDGTAGRHLYVRTSGPTAGVMRAVGQIIRQLDPHMPLVEAFTLEEEVQNSLWQERIVTILSGFFGLAALLLSATGLYATLSYAVARRSRELGIRVAIGAQLSDIIRTVCARLTWSVVIGLCAGVFGSLLLLRIVSPLLFAISPFDSMSISVSVLSLLLASAAAAVAPARRAVKADPIVALREE